MRLHTTTVLSLSALALLALAGCSAGGTPADAPVFSASAPTEQEGKHAPTPALLSSAALSKRLLDESDLGEGYTRKPQQSKPQDDVVVSGCLALEKLGRDAAVGGSLDFPRKAKASFTYAGGSNSEVAEELYSDTEAKLSSGVGRIFDAMTSCPTYQVLVGSTPVTVQAQKVAAARLGDERWSQLLTFTVGGRSSVVKQTAVRMGTVVVVVSGGPGLVDAHLAKAVDKAHRAG
ncbi:hypothetical protein F9278_22645 [Streptomyces phaeolivaceus]|uniref:Sensor domain-containing protein n=1 Tax=Streptomyces phaeolivaceus TaxID=2653200 RepID=A0A5P8K6S5_9ACTN|nr:hypothetical protein [Streptomyces phaeolivaceus]QFQ98512.1 hypothetical protein F9278_22645 [Streptomyces phaeolivaceus]